ASTYLISLSLGFILGAIVATWLVPLFSGILLYAVGILISKNLAYELALMSILSIVLIIALIIFLTLRKVNRIKPLEALNEGKKSTYFSSGLQVKLKNPLLFSRLSIKQFSAEAKQYLSSILVIVILFFFVLSLSSLSSLFTPDRMLREFYGFDYDLIVYYDPDALAEQETEFKNIMHEFTNIDDSFQIGIDVCEHDKELISLFVFEDLNKLTTLLDGRLPQEKNEILVTEFYAKREGLRIADDIQLNYVLDDGTKCTGEFIISGFFQSINYNGLVIALNQEGFVQLADRNPRGFSKSYLLTEPEKQREIVDKLQSSDFALTFDTKENLTSTAEGMNSVFQSLTIGSLLLSLLFVILSAYTVCEKIFAKESIDYGVMKAIGISNHKIKSLFTKRFLFLAISGIIIGYILYHLLAQGFLALIGSFFGVSRVEAHPSFVIILIVAILFILVFYLVANFIARKIKDLNPRELINQGN
ncbi:MAG: ABC transporter permease, partial [Clostridiaceae bacterium]|nr:ABC transporter permease [Clostridiaceae bacterium]